MKRSGTWCTAVANLCSCMHRAAALVLVQCTHGMHHQQVSYSAALRALAADSGAMPSQTQELAPSQLMQFVWHHLEQAFTQDNDASEQPTSAPTHPATSSKAGSAAAKPFARQAPAHTSGHSTGAAADSALDREREALQRAAAGSARVSYTSTVLRDGLPANPTSMCAGGGAIFVGLGAIAVNAFGMQDTSTLLETTSVNLHVVALSMQSISGAMVSTLHDTCSSMPLRRALCSVYWHRCPEPRQNKRASSIHPTGSVCRCGAQGV